ncbi:MAG: L-erythro-3,5-diaminohexanoate dehydrogenase [Deltaproteobacteria bacterium]|nr:L-erythro-3,5-diaminohexanoate dehydrogenase [Deltaproteobacteria bacterium]
MQPSVRPGDNPLGTLRVLAPEGVLPQAADRLDPGLPLYADETLLRVSRLNLDSASIRQLRQGCGEDPGAVAAEVLRIVRERGKMQNPVTGSGGMLLGEVVELGPRAPARFHPGDRVASLVSLTLTPLHLEKILQVRLDTGQVAVEGHAVLFASSPAVRMPEDLPEPAALAALDVCGAPAWVQRIVQPGDRVLILGAGKSGILSAYASTQNFAPSSSLWATDLSESALGRASALGVFARTLRADAQRPLDFLAALREAGAPEFDLVVNACNAPETETAAILAARPGGKVLFFNMATRFSRAVLSAEGLGRDVELIMGNGYAEGHVEYALDLLRRHKALREFFQG